MSSRNKLHCAGRHLQRVIRVTLPGHSLVAWHYEFMIQNIKLHNIIMRDQEVGKTHAPLWCDSDILFLQWAAGCASSPSGSPWWRRRWGRCRTGWPAAWSSGWPVAGVSLSVRCMSLTAGPAPSSPCSGASLQHRERFCVVSNRDLANIE